MPVARVFICYRRDDSAGHAGRVHDRLEREFGRDLVFMDVDRIPLGVNFTKILRDEVAKCDVLLAVIGSNWLNARDEGGNRRLDNSNDFVRIEIATALQREIPVIPILLDGARIPKVDQLPSDLEELTLRNGLEVRHASFHYDMDKLIRGLKSPSGQVGGLLAHKFRSEERLHLAKWWRIGRELISAGAGIVVGAVTAWFVGWGAGIVTRWAVGPESHDLEIIISVIWLPILMIAVALAILHWRKDLLDMEGWKSFGMVSFITCLFAIWCGQTYFVATWPRALWSAHEPEELGPGNPGFVFGYLVFGVSLLSLLIRRLKHRRAEAPG